MKTIKLLLCGLLTAMSFNVSADEVSRYQMLHPSDSAGYKGVYFLDTKTGAIKYCSFLDADIGLTVSIMFLTLVIFKENLLPHEWCFIQTHWVDSIYI